MTPEQQTWAAVAIVAGTLAAFAVRWWRSRKKAGCAGGCGCGAKKSPLVREAAAKK